MSDKKLTEEEKKKIFLEHIKKHEELKASGYMGMLPNGNIVDRREFPKAIAVQENSLFNIPKPKKL
jgi:hypothetical protein